jgi:MFS family permease
MSTTTAAVQKSPWYARLTGAHWRVLWASFLGWIFDGYETYALVVCIGPALKILLQPEQLPSLPKFAGLAIGLTLLGWGIGGVTGGIMADYIGRKRMMIYSVVAYAALTGITALSFNYASFIVLRFLTGLALGSEWSTGTSLIAESWPNEARPKGAGFMQSAFGFGTLLASLVWYLVNPFGPQAWRIVFLIGFLPAIFVFYVRRNVEESQRWVEAIKNRRWGATEVSAAPIEAVAVRPAKRPFTLAQMFREPEARRRAILLFLMSSATVIGWWGIATWIPTYVQVVAKGHGLTDLAHWAGLAGILYNIGAILGYLCSGFIADAIGRKAYLAFVFTGALVITPVTYLWTHELTPLLFVCLVNGFFTLGQFAWMAIYPAELFTSSVRSTATSFAFNSSRLFGFLGPILAGSIITKLGGYPRTAVTFGLIYLLGLAVIPFIPETKGHPLPE